MAFSPAIIKSVLWVGIGLAGTGGTLTFLLLQSPPTVQPNFMVAGLNLGGLTKEIAQKRLEAWWAAEKEIPFRLVYSVGSKEVGLGTRTTKELGVELDVAKTVERLPFVSWIEKTTGNEKAKPSAPFQAKPAFDSVPLEIEPIRKRFAKLIGSGKPARVLWDGHSIVRVPEVPGQSIDDEALTAQAEELLLKQDKSPIMPVPVKAKEKHVADAELSKITELVSSFTTHFPASNYSRTNNIQVAASKLNGTVLLPGERLSFNDTVGERTVKAGFKEAGIYKNGKHDRGLGGGICQVSSTLYNAALFGNIKIARHHNHSMPVAYVPIGRDATVNYGVIDLVLENNYPNPIAVTSEFKRGSLTFRIFGIADPLLSVKIEREGIKDWPQQIHYVFDPSLKPGQRKVTEKGSRGHRVSVYRLVYHGGRLVKRESLGRSIYHPSPTIISYGPGADPGSSPAPASPVRS